MEPRREQDPAPADSGRRPNPTTDVHAITLDDRLRASHRALDAADNSEYFHCSRCGFSGEIPTAEITRHRLRCGADASSAVVRGRAYVAGEVPEPLRSFLDDDTADLRDRRERLFAQLIFAARELAVAQIEPADGAEAAFCTECVCEAMDGGAIAHEPACRVGRVLQVLVDLVATLPGKETAKPHPADFVLNPARNPEIGGAA